MVELKIIKGPATVGNRFGYYGWNLPEGAWILATWDEYTNGGRGYIAVSAAFASLADAEAHLHEILIERLERQLGRLIALRSRLHGYDHRKLPRESNFESAQIASDSGDFALAQEELSRIAEALNFVESWLENPIEE